LVEDSFGGGPQFVDPSIDYETSGSEVIQNVNEQLMFFKGADATNTVPWLASSQTMSADGMHYTYILRSGIKFTDGTPFNASAVYFSIMRTLIIDDPSSPAWAIDQVLDGAANYSAAYNCTGNCYTQANVNTLIAANPVTIDNMSAVTFNLAHPYAAWPFIMAFSVTAVQDPTAMIKAWVTNSTAVTLPANAGGDGLPMGGVTAGDYQDAINVNQQQTDVGTGPYILTNWDRTTGDVTLQYNPNYWGGPDGSIHPTIQTILIKQVNDANTRDLDFKSGTADIATIPIATGQIFDFVNQTQWTATHTIQNIYPGVQFTGPFASLETDFVGFNQVPGALGHDKLFREAISYLFDDATFANQVEKGFSPLATQIIPPGMFGYNPNIKGVPLNATMAEQLLAADGISTSNPKVVNIYYNTGSTGREAAAVILASNINSISSTTGLTANIVTLPWPQYLHDVAHHLADVWFLGWIVDYVDPDDFLVPFASGTAGTYAIWSGFDNATIDSWVQQEAVTSNPTTRATIINNIQTAVNNAYDYIWTINGVALNYHRTWIQETPNAFIVSNIGSTYLTSLYFYYFATIQALT
jgi:peptide/nickel transport system substrate-binding protein